MTSGVAALGCVGNVSVVMLRRLAAVMFSTFCTPGVRVSRAEVPGGMVGGKAPPVLEVRTALVGHAARSVERLRKVLNADAKSMRPLSKTGAVWLPPE
jgi:hypothetical protein